MSSMKMNRHVRLTLATSLALLGASACKTPPPDPPIAPQTEFEHRSEGLLAEEVAAPDVDLLSFMRVGERSLEAVGTSLRIRFFLERDGRAQIVARRLIAGDGYRMLPKRVEWQAGWQEFAPWPPDVRTYYAKPDELGVVIAGSADSLVPAALCADACEPDSGEYELVLVSRDAVRQVAVEVVRSETQTIVHEQTLLGLVGRDIPIRVSFSLAGEPAGYYTVNLEFSLRNRTVSRSRSYTFYHGPT